MPDAAFEYRMMNAKRPELMDEAHRLGMNWVVAASSGQKGGQIANDPPVYMPDYAELAAHREARRDMIEAEKTRVRARIAHAKRLDMRVLYSTYEPSLPVGFLEAQPRLYSRQLREYRRHNIPEIRDSRELCVARAEVREAIAVKIAELCRTYPDIDGLVYTNNESGSTTKVWHRCDHCRDVPFSDMMVHLHNAMRDGIARSGLPVRLFYRCWGTHETPERYYESYRDRLAFGEADLADKPWLEPHVDVFAPEHLHFDPDRDIPRFIKQIKGDDSVVVYKATWADVNLQHPLNPWIGRYRGHDQICEISFEHCRNAPKVFYIVGREMQRRVRRAAKRGCVGVCGVPVFWGEHDVVDTAYQPAQWSLATLNLHLYAALAHDPDADLHAATMQYLEARYGRALPREIATMLLDSEDIAAGALNVRGIQAAGHDLRGFYNQLLRYGPTRKNWRQRVYPTPTNVRRVFKDKDRNVRRAEWMLARIEALRQELPNDAHEELTLCFTNLLALARRWQAGHKHAMMLWAIKEGTIEPTLKDLEALAMHCRAADTLKETISP